MESVESQDHPSLPPSEGLVGDAAAPAAAPAPAYIAPGKRKQMMWEEIGEPDDKDTNELYQRMNWKRMKMRICGQLNRLLKENVLKVARSLFDQNVVRGRGLLVQGVMKHQALTPNNTPVLAALISVLNAPFPEVGDLLIRRLLRQLVNSIKNNDMAQCVCAGRFLAHLFNQRVLGESTMMAALEKLLEEPNSERVEATVVMLKEGGSLLEQLSRKDEIAIFDKLREAIYSSDELRRNVQYDFEELWQIRKMSYKGFPIVLDELDLVDSDHQETHSLTLTREDGTPHDAELGLNYFNMDSNFGQNEANYRATVETIIEAFGEEGEDDGEEEQTAAVVEESAKPEGGDQAHEGKDAILPAPIPNAPVLDMTEQDMVDFRKRFYLHIQSSLTYEEAAHKLIKKEFRPGLEMEMCSMIVDCCSQQRTYEHFYGLLAERFCRLRREFQESFERIFPTSYLTVHRLDITKLRSVAKLFAHLLASDSIKWDVLEVIKLNEEETTSAGRIFIKILFMELAEIMSLEKLYIRLNDPTLQSAFEGILPRDHPKKTRFAINYFTLIGLAALTIDLREHLEREDKKLRSHKKLKSEADGGRSSSSLDTSSSSDSSISSTSSSSEEGGR